MRRDAGGMRQVAGEDPAKLGQLRAGSVIVLLILTEKATDVGSVACRVWKVWKKGIASGSGRHAGSRVILADEDGKGE